MGLGVCAWLAVLVGGTRRVPGDRSPLHCPWRPNRTHLHLTLQRRLNQTLILQETCVVVLLWTMAQDHPRPPQDRPKTAPKIWKHQCWLVHENPCIRIRIPLNREIRDEHCYRESLYENKKHMKKETHKWRLLIKNVDLSLEKCRFPANRGVLHYVLKRERGLPTKTVDF